MAAKIKKDDVVFITTGKDKGKSGKVLKVLPREDRVVVEGLNVVKRHVKPSMADPNGGVKEKEAAIHVSNVMIRDPQTGKPTRVGFKTLADGRKVRIAKGSGVQIDV
ncbi:MAG: 50S ribosomal protein L24 [Alphaproteobacteria bacterium]|nr:50S ribosomal protein L24 [Alphaproteobacteria bacterium]